jgi:hypothetical protein
MDPTPYPLWECQGEKTKIRAKHKLGDFFCNGTLVWTALTNTYGQI